MRAGHVAPRAPALGAGVVPVLHAHAPAQGQGREGGEVSGRVDVLARGAQALVDDHPVAQDEPGLPGQRRLGRDPRGHQDQVRVDLVPRAGAGPVASPDVLDADRLVLAQDVDAAVPVQAQDRAARAFREDAPARVRAGEDHGHVELIHGQRRRELGAEQAAADDHGAAAGDRALAQVEVVVQGPEIDDPLQAAAGDGQAPGQSARGQEELAVADPPAVRVLQRLVPGVDADDAVAQGQLDAFRVVEARLVQGDQGHALGPGPESFGERRTVVRGVLLRAQHQDAAAGVPFADGDRRGGPRQPASHDDVVMQVHGHGRTSSGIFWLQKGKLLSRPGPCRRR